MRVREAPTRSHTADEKGGRLGVGHAQKRGHRQVASPTTSHLTTRVEALGHADKHVQTYRRRSRSSRAREVEEAEQETPKQAGARAATAATGATSES